MNISYLASVQCMTGFKVLSMQINYLAVAFKFLNVLVLNIAEKLLVGC
jgi:hypothetical protein